MCLDEKSVRCLFTGEKNLQQRRVACPVLQQTVCTGVHFESLTPHHSKDEDEDFVAEADQMYTSLNARQLEH